MCASTSQLSVSRAPPGEQTPSLGGDDLGTAVKGLFTYLCPRAGMVCDRIDRDRSGRDFVVDLQMKAGLLD